MPVKPTRLQRTHYHPLHPVRHCLITAAPGLPRLAHLRHARPHLPREWMGEQDVVTRRGLAAVYTISVPAPFSALPVRCSPWPVVRSRRAAGQPHLLANDPSHTVAPPHVAPQAALAQASKPQVRYEVDGWAAPLLCEHVPEHDRRRGMWACPAVFKCSRNGRRFPFSLRLQCCASSCHCRPPPPRPPPPSPKCVSGHGFDMCSCACTRQHVLKPGGGAP